MVQHVQQGPYQQEGVDYDNEYVKIFEFDTDGKIVAVWEYMDSLYASTAFNVLEIGGATPVTAPDAPSALRRRGADHDPSASAPPGLRSPGGRSARRGVPAPGFSGAERQQRAGLGLGPGRRP